MIKLVKTLILMMVMGLVSLISLNSAQAQVVIQFKAEHTAAPDTSVTLLDLITDESLPASEAIRQKLKSQVITKVQKEGERIELSLSSLTQYLKASLSDDEKNQYRFALPKVLKIVTESPKLTLESVEKAILEKWKARCEECQIKISDLQLPPGSFKNWELVVPHEISKASFNIPLRVKMENGRDSQYWVNGKVDVLKEVPVAQRALYIGERIQSEDIKFEWRSTTFANDGTPSKNLIFGMRVKTPVSANQILWSRNLEREKAMKRGEVVRVISSGGTWELSTTAIAQKDAEIGDVIELKPLKAGKILSGIVIGQGEVQIK